VKGYGNRSDEVLGLDGRGNQAQRAPSPCKGEPSLGPAGPPSAATKYALAEDERRKGWLVATGHGKGHCRWSTPYSVEEYRKGGHASVKQQA
jgi:hypothetical protein